MITLPKGWYKCVDCGKLCQRVNSSQKRCADCQKEKRAKDRRLDNKRRYEEKKKERLDHYEYARKYRLEGKKV